MKFVIYLVAILFFGCKSKTADQIIEIEVIKVSFRTDSIFDISCDNFLPQFAGHLDTYHISESFLTKRIVNSINTSVNGSDCDIDTRAKVYIHYESGNIDTFCFGNFDCFIMNNTSRKLLNNELIKVLDSLGDI